LEIGHALGQVQLCVPMAQYLAQHPNVTGASSTSSVVMRCVVVGAASAAIRALPRAHRG